MFKLNCSEVETIANDMNTYSVDMSDITATVSAMNPTSSEFDFSGAISAINSNINGASDKMSNTQKYIKTVIDSHTQLQATLRVEAVTSNSTPINAEQGAATKDDKTTQTSENTKLVTDPLATTPEVKDPLAESQTTTSNGLTVKATYTIPEGSGTKMKYEVGWEEITDTSAQQYELREILGSDFTWNQEGFGKVGDRYLVACSTMFGAPGELIDFTLEDGTVIPCMIADSKGDPNDCADNSVYKVNEWGHENGKNVIEFIVDRTSWYDPKNSIIKDNPGTLSNHPEWGQRVVKATRYGNPYFPEKEE